MGSDNNETIDRALEELDEAAAEKKDTIRRLIAEKYANLKEMLGGAGATLSESLAAAKKKVVEAATEAKNVGVEKIQGIAKTVDDNVRRNPWPYLGGAAFGALLLGYFMGRTRSRK